MSSARGWQRVRSLFHEAIQRPRAERSGFLEQECAGDESLRGEVESLLEAHERAGGFLDRAPMPVLRGVLAAAPLTPGVRLGVFEITGTLGAGGMGEVYRARDTRLGRDVAVKLLPSVLADDPDRRARLERESRLLAALNHPHIAAIHSVEEIDGRLALILELVEGPTLADRLATGPIPIAEALQIAGQLAEALEAAHGKGVVHRDLKPTNLKVTSDGAVKLLDFGLAKAKPTGIHEGDAPDVTSANADPTHDGVILGTGAYMSPEQARGQAVDKRTDVWAFGCVLYEMLSGRRAFSGDTISDTIAAILEREPDWTALPPALPPEVYRFVRRCLQKDPRRRIHDIADARVEIEEALDAASAPADSPTRAMGASRRMLAILVVTLIVAGLVLSLVAWRLGLFAADPSGAPSLTYLSLPLPDGVGLQSPPTVSPDGSSIAFVGGDAKGRRLFVRRLGSPEFRAVPGTEFAAHPFWSPDGQWLAFFARGKLKKVAVDRGAPVDICSASEGRGGSWGRAGNIVFTPHLIDSPVYRVSANGGDPEPVTRLDESRSDNSHRWPVFLPDGVHFLYFVRSFEDGRRGIYMGRADRPAEAPGARLIESEYEALYVEFEPDSLGAVLTVVPDGVQIQRFDASTRTLVGHPRLINVRAGVSTPYEAAMIGGSQRTLAFAATSLARTTRLVSAARDGSDVRISSEREAYNWPRLSPDGTRLVLQRVDRLRGTPDLWVKDLSRGTESRVTSPPNHALLPVWSPGGDRLAFLWGRVGKAGIAIAASDGTSVIASRACPPERCEPSDWSPDGRTLILTVRTAQGSDVWTMPIEPSGTAGVARPLFAERFNERDARISPDGEWIAYVSDESGREEISVRRISGGERTVLSPGGGHQPVWRRDGAELFYVDPQGALRAVAVRRGFGGTLVPGMPVLLGVPPIGVGHWGTQYDVTRDGSRVYFLDRQQPALATRIEVILGWTALLQ
jgi:serine/threonine protein kinase/Tol biopolymer transport system component